MRLHGLVDLFHARAFGIGLAYGAVVCTALLLVSMVARRRAFALAGPLMVGAGWLGVRAAWGTTL
ncbi:MAG TPA: hypothetical protein VFR41_15540, partial [Acidimicrobiia bacterium]|nr:hypothetical protein [Acidimicrobiia bacterium]